MKFSPDNFETEFERAIRIATNYMGTAEELEKPTLSHCIRVGVYLYTHGYSRPVCLAGILHDMIEDTAMTYERIDNDFGTEVAQLVQANTKDASIGGWDQFRELDKRCIAAGEDAAIVKAADILDNYYFFHKINDQDGIKKVDEVVKMFCEQLPENFQDPIFGELKKFANQPQ